MVMMVVVFNDIVLLLLLEMETSLCLVVSVVVSWSFQFFSFPLFAANADVVVPVGFPTLGFHQDDCGLISFISTFLDFW